MFAIVLTNGKVWAVRATIEAAREVAQRFDKHCPLGWLTVDHIVAI